MNYYHSLQHQLPRPLLSAADYVQNTDLKKTLEEEVDVEKLQKIIEEIQRWSIRVDTTTVGFIADTWVRSAMENLDEKREDTDLIKSVKEVLEALTPLSLTLNLWVAQNIYFSIGKTLYDKMRIASDKGDDDAGQWVTAFSELGFYLQVKM